MLNDMVQLSLPICAPFFSFLSPFFPMNYKISGLDRRKTFAKHPRTINHVSPFFLTMALADSALLPLKTNLRFIQYIYIYSHGPGRNCSTRRNAHTNEGSFLVCTMKNLCQPRKMAMHCIELIDHQPYNISFK